MDMKAAPTERERGSDDGLGELTKGWCWASAKEFSEIVGGGTPKNAADVSNFTPNGVPWITPADLSGYLNPTIRRGTRSLSERGLKNSSAQLLPKGSLLISSRAPVGYCVVADQPLCTNQGFKSLKFRLPTNPFFLRYYVIYAKRKFNEAASGTTFKELSGRAMGDIAFPLAPLPEQGRIVERIDALFADIAEGEASLEEARKGLETFRRALLKAAVTGELTRDWREMNKPTETGHDLLAGIVQSRATKASSRRRGRRVADTAPLDTSALPNLPTGWAWATLGQLFDVRTGSTPSRSDLTLWNGGVPWVSSGEVAFCRIRSTHENISLSGLGNPETRLNPIGTVLLAMIGEGKTRGQCAILDIPAANNQNAAAIRVSETPIPPEYVYHVLEERYFRSRRESQGGNQPALNAGKVAEMALPLPPLSETIEILRRVSEALSAQADVLAMLEAEAADAVRLKQAILKAAFEGKLVDQDPDDEPAGIVLGRLKSSPRAGISGRGKARAVRA